jgi:ADP-heptose:LPS heptosyltransferase
MTFPHSFNRDILFISARNFGDAALHANFIREFSKKFVCRQIYVWTTPEAKSIFESIDNINIIESYFPVGMGRNKFFTQLWFVKIIYTILKLRKLNLYFAFDFTSDFREQLFIYLVGASYSRKIGFPKHSAFRNFVWFSGLRILPSLSTKPDSDNLYTVYDRSLYLLRDFFSPSLSMALDDKFLTNVNHSKIIGIHPFASQDFKMWPVEYWIKLIKLIKYTLPDYEIHVFGTPEEFEKFNLTISDGIYFKPGSINSVMKDISTLCLLICLESFSNHLATFLSIPSLVISGANNPGIFVKSTNFFVSNDDFLNCQYCNGKPTCLKNSTPYLCMSLITPEIVLSKILTVLEI